VVSFLADFLCFCGLLEGLDLDVTIGLWCGLVGQLVSRLVWFGLVWFGVAEKARYVPFVAESGVGTATSRQGMPFPETVIGRNDMMLLQCSHHAPLTVL